MSHDDPFDLERFVNAQRDVYSRALSEIKSGQKKSHWMWFVFPQIIGLGNSPTSILYSIKSINEAKAYLSHSILGPRLAECSSAVLKGTATSAEQIFGSIDAVKLCSSLTLFDYLSPGTMFSEVIGKYFDNRRDDKTLTILAGMSQVI
jgi:uncharacterized protein (DUF1810 family)